MLGVFHRLLHKTCQQYAEKHSLTFGELTLWKIDHLAKSAEESLEKVGRQNATPSNTGAVKRRAPRRMKALDSESVLSASPYQLVRSLFETKEDASEMLVVAPSAEQLPPIAFNVFSIDGRRICPAGLRVLARLHDTTLQPAQGVSPGVSNVARLVEDFERHGYDDEDLRDALEEMVRPERRLIYSGISDWFDGVDRLFEERNRHVRLSWAGIGYYETLLNVPAFLQWSFQGIEEIDRIYCREYGSSAPSQLSSIESRMQAAHLGFNAIINDEYDRLSTAWERADSRSRDRFSYMRRHETSNQNESLNLYFDTLQEFVRTLSSHANRVRGNRGRAEEARRLAAKWIVDGQDWLEKHCEIFGDGRDNPIILVWAYEIDCSKEVLARFPK